MKRLSKKLHSQRGASILLALLLFLVCAMVAASILAAAVSNAGKVRSNRVEQQKYLTLSSAIRLVADELQKAEYTGKYKIYEWTVTTVSKDAAGNEISSSNESFFYIEQGQGDYTCGDLTSQLPLKKELDDIFSKQFTETGFTALSGTDVEGPTVRILTVSLPDGLSGYPYPADAADPKTYEISGDVTVRVTLDHNTRHIRLTAWLGTGATPPDGGSNTMTVELVAKNAPTIGYVRGGRTAGASKPTAGTSTSASGGTTTTTTVSVTKDGETTSAAGAPMQWELHWIRKGAA